MRTERFRWVLNAAGSADPKWFASEKQHMEKRERRFVGFIKPSNRRLFAFSGQIKGGSPERRKQMTGKTNQSTRDEMLRRTLQAERPTPCIVIVSIIAHCNVRSSDYIFDKTGSFIFVGKNHIGAWHLLHDESPFLLYLHHILSPAYSGGNSSLFSYLYHTHTYSPSF